VNWRRCPSAAECFVEPFGIFPETIVAAGEEGVIAEQVNEIQTVGILPDNLHIRAALLEWHSGEILYLTPDDEWHGETPLIGVPRLREATADGAELRDRRDDRPRGVAGAEASNSKLAVNRA
jgi:hypothetical protein